MSNRNELYGYLKQRITQKQKDKSNKQWYKDNIDLLDAQSFSNITSYGDVNEYKKKKVNYDLYNNIINLRDFEYVCQPYGAEAGELPADMTNRDIVSGKIKALLGMESKRPFAWKVVATNEEATTRIEKEEFSRIKEWVISQIMQPIQAEIQQEVMQQQQGKPPSPEQQSQIQKQVAERLKAATPPEVKKYIEREHQDPAEAVAHQVLEYLLKKEKVQRKFQKGFKHSCISGEEIYWVGEVNNEPCLTVVNPLYFDYDKGPDLDFIEDGEWALCEYRMTPSQIVKHFGSQLSNQDIDNIYEKYPLGGGNITDEQFYFNPNHETSIYTVRVLHGVWKSLRKIGFLKYVDEAGNDQERIVDETYKLIPEAGDVSIEWEWIPEVHECWKIGYETYVQMRPIPSQYKDMDNLYNCKLPYIGGPYDNLNSETTAILDRMKPYQYYYNILMYRIELLLASDKGKLLLMNMNMVPKSAGIDTDQWLYFLESTKVGWLNPNEEGNKGQDVVNAAKAIDMSMASNIQNYINLAEYVERKCGESVGITRQVEGQMSPSDLVGTTRQSIVQSSHILEPYFEFHNTIKQNVLTALIECAKVSYSKSTQSKLTYVIDDLSRKILTADFDLLDNSTYGLFVENSAKAFETKEMITQLAHAALQNQTVELSDIIKIVRANGVQEAEEMLKVAEKEKREAMDAQQQRQIQAAAEEEEKKRNFEREKMEHDLEKIRLEEKLKTDREIQKQAMLSIGFNEDKDVDRDGKLDVMEVAQQGIDANLSMRKQALDEQKFLHDREVDKEKLKIEKKKAGKNNK